MGKIGKERKRKKEKIKEKGVDGKNGGGKKKEEKKNR